MPDGLDQVLYALGAIVVGGGVMAFYFYGSNWLLDTLLRDRVEPDGRVLESRENQREAIRPWLFVGPALLVLGLYLVYPAIQTVILSFGDKDGNIEITRTTYPEEVNALRLNYIQNPTQERVDEIRAQLAEIYPAAADVDLGDLEQYENTRAVIETLLTESGVELGTEFVLFRNYEWAFFEEGAPQFWESVRNNILWLLVPVVSTALGLLIAVLADRVRWGTIAKSLIFMPMAISFVGASVIWKFVYDANLPNPGQPIPNQIGVLNAIVVALGGQPQDWIALEPWNNFFLMVILIWGQTGFAMVLLASALRGVPEETLEAARIDGASEIQVFFRIMIPQILSTILVVMTTITILVLKVYDIVAAMTNGQFGTQILANQQYNEAFRAFNDGRGSMLATIIMVAVIPILIWNLRQYRKQETNR